MANETLSEQVMKHVLSVTDREFAGLTVSILAILFNIERYNLSRQFKRQTQMTLEKFLLTEKMTRAAFLLRYSCDITVKEVAERIGFCTCDYFIRKFKEHYGVRPGRYKIFKHQRTEIVKKSIENRHDRQ
ncbi:MAG: helix-turn-helix transcriptional regulator [bacterium]|nr:helix-turn-helix transcriptional regulator [bacterium]